ncbi:hypothetical protein, partial [Mesorhizobium sp. M7A.T.Ca.US.000.02.2.1]|uniref:hypothetical protein n=1 Tax=Mesorhizobium sp. M7A.T.Ca.US.000.02.2.1 TaxID=2496793 RepID=UPI001AED08FC
PVGGGLGVYEPVPDRTVSGNTGKFVGHWGMSADKKRQKCGGTSPIPTRRFIKVTGRNGNSAARGSVRWACNSVANTPTLVGKDSF